MVTSNSRSATAEALNAELLGWLGAAMERLDEFRSNGEMNSNKDCDLSISIRAIISKAKDGVS